MDSADANSTATGNKVLPNSAPPEKSQSTDHSPPAVRPSGGGTDGTGSDHAVQLNDIRCITPLDDAPENDETSATTALPQDACPGSPQGSPTRPRNQVPRLSALTVPSVTIFTSHPHSRSSFSPVIAMQADIPTPNHTSAFPDSIARTLPLSSENVPDISASTASSALTDGDKLTDLPASFSAPRLQALARKAAEASGIPSQDSMASSLIAQSSRRSGDSEHSSFAGKIRGDVTPKRVSFDGERPSFSSSFQNVRNAFMPASPDGRANEVPNARSPSSPARSPSPLRNFILSLHRSHAREDPFVPVDPYNFNICRLPRTYRHILSQVVRQLYRHLLLRLPSIYFTRVSRVFADAEVSRPEVLRMIEGRNKGDVYRWPASHEWVAPNVSPSLIRFKESWETFVESMLKEWKTLNVVSALLLTCVVLLPIYSRVKPEIDGASTAPIIRTTAFLSLICALMSLLYGCVYILRFGTMKSMYRASRWAEEAQQATSILWNVWVLLAMPAVWISWSMLFFCISILDFVWDQPFSSASSPRDFTADLAGTSKPISELSLPQTSLTALVPRILISLVFVLGLIYFALVVRTFRSWGDPEIPPYVHEKMEAGIWTPRSSSPRRSAPASPRLSHESRIEIGDEKSGTKQVDHKRLRSVL